ncbi:putative FERM domain-containing protein 8 [Hypsibius exemplaris]|uniref:FERM domain-containing protein 8 n=1 Tax=Hypsibius exemplaris TaxID=2072580 RepID=A0A1W0WQ34_HYPEX|nr:putative FERM domain-containing protein 8 [Hypsibius exemplaris]
MRANRSPQREASGSLYLRRPIVPTIREIDENGEETNVGPSENAYLFGQVPEDEVDGPQGRGELAAGVGTLPVRRHSDASKTVEGSGSSVGANPESQGRSFERIIESLFVRAQIHVYLMDYTPFDFHPVTGYDCRAPEIIEALIKARNLDHAQARKTFAVWFTNSTDALDVQLKPHHNPFIIQRYWRYFLRRYANADAHGNEAPVVYVRRSLWLRLEDEKRLSNPRVLQLLFEEARNCYLGKRYSLSVDDVLTLGCLLIYKDHGRASNNTQHVQAVRKQLLECFPQGLIPTQRKAFQKNRQEEVISEIMRVYQSLSARNNDEVRLRFLLVCRNNPLYAAVFFSGVLEPAPKSRLTGLITGFADVPVALAVNERGFFVLSAVRKDDLSADVIMALAHNEISVTYKTPSEEHALHDVDMACLMVTTTVPLEDDDAGDSPSGVPRVLKIFSKQAPLMAACLITFHHSQRAAEFSRRDNIINGLDAVDEIDQPVVPASTRPDTTVIRVMKEAGHRGRHRHHKVTAKTARSVAFPDILNRFDAFVLHSVDED